MKQIELELKKRLLIVELPEKCEFAGIKIADKVNPTIYYWNERMTKDDYPIAFPLQRKAKFICKGSELTEEIAMELVMEMYSSNEERMMYRDYRSKYDDEVVYDALESFISSIEAQGYCWGENPVKRDNIQTDDGTILNIKYNSKEWQEAELKTFNLSKTLIFEILL